MDTTTNTWVHPFEKTGLGKAPFRFSRYEQMTYRAHPDAPAQPGGSCDHCGTAIMHAYWIASADGRTFKVGCDCVFKTYRTAPKKDALYLEVRKAQREMLAAQRDVKRTARREAVRAERKAALPSRKAAFLAVNPGLDLALALDHPTVRDIAAKLDEWGDLSPRQVDFVWSLYAQAYGPQVAPEVNVPAPTGKVTVRGKVVSTKVVDSMYGTQWKMVVKVSDAQRNTWLVWTTVPRNLVGGYNPEPGSVKHLDDLKGCEVQFNATLEPGRESHFAFGKRPTKASITNNPNA